MENSDKMKRRKGWIRLTVAGILAGVANGLLGAGGGILAVYGLTGVKEEWEPRDLYATALCVMLPVSGVSCIRYAMKGNLSTEDFAVYALPAVAGGLLGAVLLGRLRGTILRRLFGSLVVCSGILLMLK